MCIHVKGKDQIKTTTDQSNALFPFLDVGNRTITDCTRKYYTHRYYPSSLKNTTKRLQ